MMIAYKLKQFYLFGIALLCCSLSLKAAKIYGRITDDDGAALSFASVLIKGTSLGTSANADGYYSLNLPEGKYQILVQYIGYRQVSWACTLAPNDEVKHDFSLEVQGYELKDVVIQSGGEDPAYRIIRNAIKRREFHLKQMQSFQTSIYLKGVLRNRSTPDKILGVKIKEEDKKDFSNGLGLDTGGKGVLYLCEEMADYYTEGKKEKIVVHSVKESGSPNGVGLGSVPSVINFYQNNVNVLSNNNEFLSPIAGTALGSYTYKLMGDFEENGQRIYKIKVSPKRKFERCFDGDIYIADQDWAIHSLKLWATQKQGLDILDTLKTEQIYIPLSKDLWVIKNQVFYPTIKILGFDISGNFVTVYDNQKVNEPIPDSIFNRKIAVTYFADANKRDSAYWLAERPMKLEADELRNYDFRDSLYVVTTDPNRIDSLRKRANKFKLSNLLSFGSQFNTKEYKTSWNISGILFDLNYNTIEGLNYAPSFSMKHRIDTGKVLSWENDLRYGFHNGHFNAKTKVRYTQSDRNWTGRYWSITASGGQYISQFNTEQPVNELYNTFSSLFQKNNYFKIFERSFAGLALQRNYGNGFQWSISGQYEHRMPLANTSDYSWVSSSHTGAYTPNVATGYSSVAMSQNDAFIAQIGLSYQPGIRYIQYPNRKVAIASRLPIFSLHYKKGIPNIFNSVSDFDKWDLQVKGLLDLNRKGNLEYHLETGGFLNSNTVAIPDLMHLYGNQYVLAAPYMQSFQLAPYYQYSNTAKLYGILHLEYALKGFISNKVPLLRQLHWYFVLGNNTFYANSNQYYTEAFVGLDNIGVKVFRFLRVDFVKGWDSYKQNYSGIRIGAKLGNTMSGSTINSGGKAAIF